MNKIIRRLSSSIIGLAALGLVGQAQAESFATSFEFTRSNSFVIGNSPLTATFSGGSTKAVAEPEFSVSGNNALHVPDNGLVVVTFPTPADRVEFWVRDAPGAAQSFYQVFDDSGILLQSRDGTQAYRKLTVTRSGTESRIGRIEFASAGGAETFVDDFAYVATESEANTRITGALEEPINGAIHSGVGNLRGWAISPAGIERVDIFIDGSFEFSAPYGGSRTDVGDTFPETPGSDVSGFSLAYGYSNLLPGVHEITARVFANDGKQEDFSSTFTVVGFDKEFITSADPVNATNSSLSATGDEITVQNVSIGDRQYDIKMKWRVAEQGFEIIEIR